MKWWTRQICNSLSSYSNCHPTTIRPAWRCIRPRQGPLTFTTAIESTHTVRPQSETEDARIQLTNSQSPHYVITLVHQMYSNRRSVVDILWNFNKVSTITNPNLVSYVLNEPVKNYKKLDPKKSNLNYAPLIQLRVDSANEVLKLFLNNLQLFYNFFIIFLSPSKHI